MREKRVRWTTQQSLEEPKAYRPSVSTPPIQRSPSLQALNKRSLRAFRVKKPSVILDLLLVLLPFCALIWRLGGIRKLGAGHFSQHKADPLHVQGLVGEARRWLERQRGHAECVGSKWTGIPFSSLQTYLRKRFSSRPQLSEELLELEELLRADRLESAGINTDYTLDGPWRVSTHSRRLPFLCLPNFIFRTHPLEALLWLGWFVLTAVWVLLRREERALLTHAERIYRQLFSALRITRMINPLDAVPELRLLDERKYQRLYCKLNSLRLEDGKAVIIPRGSQHFWSLL